jgi:uncharacterized integral membrane protein (TIGR00697 family)
MPEPSPSPVYRHHWGSGQRYSAAFVVLVALLVTSQLVGGILGVKLVQVGPLIFDGALILFPVSYICGDVITEVYGYRTARRAIWLGFACSALVVLTTAIVQWLPPAPGWSHQAEFEVILGVVPRLVLASFLANLAGEFVNAGVLSTMKRRRPGGPLWQRFVGSTVAGQGVNSLIFYVLAFTGTVPFTNVLWGVVSSWLFKSAYETVALPVTYRVVAAVKRLEKLDVIDDDLPSYTPFSLNGR